MARESEPKLVTKDDIVARIDAARWQVRRDLECVTVQFAQRTSVRGQLQESIRRRPSAWGVGAVVAGFFLTRLVFGRKTLPKAEKASPTSSRWPILGSLGGVFLKMVFSTFQPSLTKVATDRLLRHPNSKAPHV